MAEILKTLIPAGNPAGPGDYTIMVTAESDNQQDLVSGGNTFVLECYAGLDTAGFVVWDGWTCDDTHFITIKAAAGEEHNGVEGAGYILSAQADSGFRGVIINRESSTVIQDITVENARTTSGSTTYGCVSLYEGWRHKLYRLILRSLANGAADESSCGVYTASGRSVNNVVIENCWMTGGAFGVNNLGTYGSWTINSCTIDPRSENRQVGMSWTGTQQATINNCAVYSSGVTYGSNPLNAAGASNASSDGVAPGTDPVLNITTAAFVDYAGGDMKPTPAGVLDGTGVDLSGSFTTDITGATRVVPWDIGAYALAGGPPPVGVQEMYIKDGGIFVKYTPHVKVGGTFQEVDAYVLEGGTWKPVHEK